MGKIRVKDLAQMMGIANQDLVFKLKSIGVRLEDENPTIDSDVIEAVLHGKSLRNPREVILRDKEAKAAAPAAPRRRPPSRRMPASPRRPLRRRTMIQKVEPRIKTIPVTEPKKPEPAATPAVTAPPAVERPTAAPAAPPAAARAKAGSAPAVKTPPTVKKPAPAAPAARVARRAAGDERPADSSARRKRRSERKRQEQELPGVAFKEGAPEGVVTVSEGMTVRDYSEKLGVKAKDLQKALFKRGAMATINQVLDVELAKAVATDLGVEVRSVSFEEEVRIQDTMERETSDEESVPRGPVVTIMGHVDHGKTTLLDHIRSSKITEGEHGGITQHIGAYQVETANGKVVFLDTPGHEAFTLMRARGARATDIVILVVAADDGVMPQTKEAIDHAKAAGVPLVVAINKIDKANANVDKVKKELAEYGVQVEDWGGDVVSAPISAIKGEGVPELLELVQLTADLLELRADPTLLAHGVVLEARKEAGRGIVATVLVQTGTLRVADVFVAGATWGRVRAMSDDLGRKLDAAGPATPVEVTGFGDVPEAGDLFQVVGDESKARGIVEFRQHELRQRELAPAPSRVSLERLFDNIQEGGLKELLVVLKADVQGSVEVLTETLRKLSTDQVQIQLIRAGVGAVTTDDVLLASASNAVVVGFNVRPEKKAADLAAKEEVDIRLHTVIYELSDEIRKAMTGLLEPTFREVVRGRAEVREIFGVPRHGTVAGCHVVEGTVPRNASARLLRDNVVVHEGAIGSLRRFKDDVAEVRTGFDCGIRLERYQDLKPGDIIEVYEREEVAPTL